MRIITVFILTAIFSVAALAQSTRTDVNATDALERLQQREMNGQGMISMDKLVQEHYRKHLVYNSRNRGIEGYRIRIFSDNGHGAKDEQMRVRARFLSLHPEISSYPEYEGSYYKIYVGNFRTKRDALRTMDIIRKDFPDAFIVEDKIIIEE
ncbi:MAG: SPOR domain-containing protein [Bacteroidales bacterium]|nr:SPOR domain-containing protein [Bacteroidales bacterium]MDT8432497.1 SPOR domain-containing protein [Bacteroidales bacterium]